MKNNITITAVNVHPISNGIANCIGIAQFIINDCVKVTGVKLFQSKNGSKRWIVYPRNNGNKQKKSYFYPLNDETASYILAEISKAYDAANLSPAE
jgi:DNA-binding cell septation regulator SpoVG